MNKTTAWTIIALTIIGASLAIAVITEIHNVSKELRKLRRALVKARGSDTSPDQTH
jgi:hypothetical protein